MRIAILLMALLSFPAKAQDCLGESEIFLTLVAVKSVVNAGIKKSPESFYMEKWIYIWGGSGLIDDKNVSWKTAESMSRLVAENDFSDNPEVEVNIFEDYWYLSCEAKKKGESVNPLKDISKDSLLECWEKVASREEFQSCLKPLLENK